MTNHVELRQAGRTLAVPEGVTILEAALADEIAYPHGCRSGRCGSCKSRLVSGKVDLLEHSRFALSDEENAHTTSSVSTSSSTGPIRWSLRRANTLGSRSRALPPATIRWQAGRASEREFEFHIRRVPGGAATQHIHAFLKLGDPVLLEGPFGSSYLREQHTGPILCVAGGSGLAPIKGIVEAGIARGMKQPIHVHFGARSDRDLYLVDHFEGLAQRHLIPLWKR